MSSTHLISTNIIATHLAVGVEKCVAAAARLLDGSPHGDGGAVIFELEPVLVVEQGHLQDSIPLPPVPGSFVSPNNSRWS